MSLSEAWVRGQEVPATIMRTMTHTISCLLVLFSLFGATGTGLAAAEPAPARKVLLIGVDGLRPDAMMVAETPNIDWLIEHGCYSLEARTDRITVSGPGWSDMLVGVWSSRHEVVGNEFMRPRYDKYPHFFTRLKEARPDIVTASFISWEPIDKYLLNDANCDHRFFLDYDKEDGDETLPPIAAGLLRSGDPDVTFFYFADVDVAGHAHGFHPAVPEYLAEISHVDGKIGLLLDAIRARPTYADEDWLILLSTDHGGTIDGNHGRDEPKHRKIPFIASGPSTARGVIYPTPNVVDMAATICAFLGIDVDPSWGWDSKPSGLPKTIEYETNLLFNGDAEFSAGASESGVDLGVPGWIDVGSMTIVQYGAPEYPEASSPGLADRGSNFFAGSAEEDCWISQTIDVSQLATDIDREQVTFELSGWFGGYAEQRDLAWLTARFLDERGGELGTARAGPVTLGDRQRAFARQLSQTGLLHRAVRESLPSGTRSIEVILEAERHEGLTDGYADNLSLILRRR